MGKKKRSSDSSLNSEVISSSSKDVSSSRSELDNIPENIHIFKNPKFVLAKAAGKKNRVWKSLRQIASAEKALSRAVTYSSIDSPVSLKPPKKYSDISGFEAKYTDPQTKMRFSNAAEFQIIRSLQPETVNNYLSLRKANLM
ncbi:INO80 complex subunit C [Parasteatoda tepidariorum]|uniref:INO80 complex subunit C n=1 Tax=Parasteatoda tepidariorum TaxID=114398 RepID=UPI00077FCF0A|nr:INO80 complex subunit C-like [Parasteatoda tepidariorum]